MFSALVDTSLTEAKYWSYIAEGGASIVVRYMGVANSTFTGHVLRLRKRPISPATSSKAAEDVEQKSLRFQADVIAKLLPPDAVPVLHLALVEQAWLEELAIHIESARPPTRRAVDCIDIDRPYAILAPNLISDTGVSIEIKVRAA
jgi:inositol-pentakisphosphate 2-kinase